MRRRALITAVIIVAVFATGSAHIVEVVGTVVDVQESRLEVRIATGETVGIKLDPGTPVMRDRRHVDISEVKAGVRVEVETLDDADAELVAFLITILPAKK